MQVGVRAKQVQIRDARAAEEIAKHQTEMNRRNGYDEVVFPANMVDIGATEKEITRLQVSPMDLKQLETNVTVQS